MIDDIVLCLTSTEDKLAFFLSCRTFIQLIRKAKIEVTRTSDAFFRLHQQIGSGGNCRKWALCTRCGKLRPAAPRKWPFASSDALYEAYGYVGVSTNDRIVYVSKCITWAIQPGVQASAINGKHNCGECPQCYLESKSTGYVEGRKYY